VDANNNAVILVKSFLHKVSLADVDKIADKVVDKVADMAMDKFAGKVAVKVPDMAMDKAMDKAVDMVVGKVVDRVVDRVVEEVVDVVFFAIKDLAVVVIVLNNYVRNHKTFIIFIWHLHNSNVLLNVFHNAEELEEALQA
jgi:hypothetical protein